MKTYTLHDLFSTFPTGPPDRAARQDSSLEC